MCEILELFLKDKIIKRVLVKNNVYINNNHDCSVALLCQNAFSRYDI